jgi:hypothetical protein
MQLISRGIGIDGYGLQMAGFAHSVNAVTTGDNGDDHCG